MTRSFLILFGFVLMLNACTKTNEEELLLEAQLQKLCTADSVKFASDVLPIMNTKCMPCHDNSQQQGGITLVTYDDISAMADNGSLIGTMSHQSGYVPMPEGEPKLNDCYIQAIQTWINNGKPNN